MYVEGYRTVPSSWFRDTLHHVYVYYVYLTCLRSFSNAEYRVSYSFILYVFFQAAVGFHSSFSQSENQLADS